ncbi:MAG: fibro-slime domain-containing protein [Fibromonadales bacterium]|nr:fibro-slime domain-containing protein [Fibromonadales bacterium]
MNPIQKLALILFTVALLFSNASAQGACTGKTVFIQLPSDWNKDNIYVKSDNVVPISLTPIGNWLRFTFPAGNNFNNAGKSINFTMQNNDNGTNRRITSVDYDKVSNQNSFNCSDFFQDTSYIYEELSSSGTGTGKTVLSAEPPTAKTLYFLPPSTPEWTLGEPYLVWFDGSLQYLKLTFDSRCGWFKTMWLDGVTPNTDTYIYLNRGGDDKVGLLGMEEEEEDWGPSRMPTPFNLHEIFNSSAIAPERDLFFIPAGGNPMWSKTDQGREGVCSYNFAAIIYDTDGSVNSSFRQSNTESGTGIRKNIPRNVLAPDAKGVMKMQFNQAKNGWEQQNFIDAFKSTPGKNVVRCYDMPFKRNKEGLWEFNSNKLCRLNNAVDLDGNCSSNGGFMYGFFPDELQIVGDGDYSQCDACRNRHQAESFVPLNTSISQYCYDRGRNGTATSGNPATACGAEFAEGNFSNGDLPAIWNWDNNIWPGNARPTIPDKNALFCFESTPAELTYEPGQQFFFSGDDDIWVYISNQLVIDLGGSHLAAPGYVNLDDLVISPEAQAVTKDDDGNPRQFAAGGKLKAGEKYPINIFFCDRRLTMSNVRITTDMYFAQKNLLSVAGNTQLGGAQVCIESSGNTGTCASVMNGSASLGGTKCGQQLGNILDYYMINRRGDTLFLNQLNPACEKNGNDLQCYNGVYLNNYYTSPEGAVEKVVTTGTYNGLAGSYKVYANVKPSFKSDYPGAEPLYITSLTAGSKLNIIWGDIYDDSGKFLYSLGPKHKYTVSGKRVPIAFSMGEWRCSDDNRKGLAGCEFEVYSAPANEGGALGAIATIPAPATTPGGKFAELRFYSSETSPDEITRPVTEQIPANITQGPVPGILLYWVDGDYRAEDDQTHSIGNDLKVTVYLPRLAFIDPATIANANPTQLTVNSQTKGSEFSLTPVLGGAKNMGVMIGEVMPRAVAAYDISTNPMSLCTTCNFKLSLNAWVEQDGVNIQEPSTKIMQATPASPDLVNGVASFAARGLFPVDPPDFFAYFNVMGPNTTQEKTFAKWDSLLFEKPEVPYPTMSAIYDANGDGFADSLRIVYDRAFPKCEIDIARPTCVAGILDSLPSVVEVFWDPEEVFRFGKGNVVTSGNDTISWTASGNAQTDYNFWNGGCDVRNFKTKIEQESIIISEDSTLVRSILVIYGDSLSNMIKTEAKNPASITSWATFVNTKKGQTTPSDFPLGTNINDSVPAIVVKATYDADKNTRCGSGPTNTCKDLVTIYTSEPVIELDPKGDVLPPNVRMSPFAYLLRSRGFQGSESFKRFDETIDLAKNIRSNTKGDVLNLSYERFRAARDTTNTPIGGDSVRFVWAGLGQWVFTDLVGNLPNPREIGKRLDGANPFVVEEVRIAEIDPERDILKEAIEKELGKDIADTLFGDNKQVAFIPAEEIWTADSIRVKFPGSVGIFLTPDVAGEITKLGEGVIVDAKDIKFYAKAYYHTNLASYVVESQKLEISCTDPIFTAFGDADCRSSSGTPKGIYLAWNLKDAKNRWVGAGAYIEVYDFHWTIEYTDTKQQKKLTKTYNKVEKQVEMLGVKRAKKKK